jgi:hypothetical protein
MPLVRDKRVHLTASDRHETNKEHDMLFNIARLIGAAAVTVLVITAGPQRAFAGTQVPFKGSYSGTISPPHGPPPVTLSGSGTATHLGRSTNSGTVTVTSEPASCSGGFHTHNLETLTSTDGDQINLTISDQPCPVSPGVFQGSGTYVVTGGTGRFAGASGSGSFYGSGDFNQGTYTFSLKGTISQPTE